LSGAAKRGLFLYAATTPKEPWQLQQMDINGTITFAGIFADHPSRMQMLLKSQIFHSMFVQDFADFNWHKKPEQLKILLIEKPERFKF